jgi:hypothetical protein
MFCWLCISKYACNETNLMHYLSSLYWVITPVHVLGLVVAHHQEEAMYICDNWYALYVLVDCRRAWMEWNWVFHRHNTHSMSLSIYLHQSLSLSPPSESVPSSSSHSFLTFPSSLLPFHNIPSTVSSTSGYTALLKTLHNHFWKDSLPCCYNPHGLSNTFTFLDL